MAKLLLIMAGGALGTAARVGVSEALSRLFGAELIWVWTMVVNITGSFVIGFVGTASGENGRLVISQSMRQFLMIGICGGYTTFSSFSLQTLSLAEKGEWMRAGANVVFSVVLCLIAVWLGHFVAVSFGSSKGS